MSTRKLTDIANDMLQEASGKKKQFPELLKLVNDAINQYAKSERNEENMLDVKIKSSSIVDGKIKIDLCGKGEKESWNQDDDALEFTLVPKTFKKPADSF